MKTLVDLFNILHIDFSVAQNQAMKEKGSFTEDDVGLYYHKVLDSVIWTAKSYGQVIFANEGRGSLDWRRSIYPNYKANRKKDDTYKIFKDHLNDVLELISYFPSKTISVDGAEADDVMFSLATYFANEKDEDVLVITSDRDMAQLINYSDRISVYSPMTRSFREKQPNIVLEKSIVGDPSDNIPGIPRVGIKTFEKALVDKNVWDSKIAPNMAIVEDFLKIVDLSKAPENLRKESIVKYNSMEYTEFRPKDIEAFMFENGLNDHLGRWQNDLSEINMKLYENNLETISDRKVEEVMLDDVDDMINFINNL